MPDTELANMALGAAIGAADLFYTEQSDVEKRVTGAMLAANTANYLSGLSTTTTLTDSNLIYVNQTTDKAITAANLRLDMQKNTRCIYARDYGAVFDGLWLKDITTSSGSAIITSAGYTFTSADVGKRFVIKAADTSTVYMASGGSTIAGTISSVAGNQATLSATLPTTVAGTAQFYFGTDDTAAIQAAINACNPEDTTGSPSTWYYRYSGVVVFPVGMSMITAELILRTNVSFQGQGYGATWMKWASANSMATSGYYAMFTGYLSNGSSRLYRNNQFRDFRIDMTAAYTTSYSYNAKCIVATNMIHPVFSGLFLEGSPATSIGVDFVSGGLFVDNYFLNSGRLWSTGGGGGSAMDFQTGAGNFTGEQQIVGSPLSSIVSRNIIINPMVSGIRCTDNDAAPSAPTTTRTLIANNFIISNLTQGKGIEDNGNTGAIIIGNTINNIGTGQTSEGPIGSEGQHIWCGIMVTGGWNGVMANNSIYGPWHDGIRLNRFQVSTSPLTPKNYIVTGNTVMERTATAFGLILTAHTR